MTHSQRISFVSLVGLLAACASNDSIQGTSGASSSDGQGTTTSAGSPTTASASTTGSSSTVGTTGASTTTGSNGSGGQASTTTTTAVTDAGGTSSTDGASATTTGVAGAGTTDSTTGAATTGGGAGGSSSSGDISITDPVPGFASIDGGTSGGGTDIGSAIVVSSMGELTNAAGGDSAAIILVEPGDYSGTLAPGSNKTIIGTAPGVTLTGNISISGVSNIIIRNIAVRGLRCNSYDECRAGADAVYIGNGAHHVWLDHFDIADGQDGNCDYTQGGDNVTVSWSHFHYTYDKEHRYSNLIAGSDTEPNSVGKLRITYMNSHWGERVDSRQPRGRFGNVHMLNNYHNTGGGQIHGVGVDMALIAENSVYEENRAIWTDMGSPRGWQGIGNEGSGQGLNDSRGTVFDIPYEYTAMPASEVVAAVTSPDCGAGNTCTLAY